MSSGIAGMLQLYDLQKRDVSSGAYSIFLQPDQFTVTDGNIFLYPYHARCPSENLQTSCGIVMRTTNIDYHKVQEYSGIVYYQGYGNDATKLHFVECNTVLTNEYNCLGALNINLRAGICIKNDGHIHFYHYDTSLHDYDTGVDLNSTTAYSNTKVPFSIKVDETNSLVTFRYGNLSYSAASALTMDDVHNLWFSKGAQGNGFLAYFFAPLVKYWV